MSVRRVPALTLPDNLPSISSARLPQSYEAVQAALATCERIDECKDWADKAAALASYAKQAGDEGLRKKADRIRARAIRRCGELLRAIDPSRGGRPPQTRVDADQVSRSQAARVAGLKPHQKRDALRVAQVPEPDFERAVESDDPPTVTALAEQGKAPRPLTDLQGRDPEEFAISTRGQGQVRRLAEFAELVRPEVVVRGALPHEWDRLKREAHRSLRWLEALLEAIEEAGA